MGRGDDKGKSSRRRGTGSKADGDSLGSLSKKRQSDLLDAFQATLDDEEAEDDKARPVRSRIQLQPPQTPPTPLPFSSTKQSADIPAHLVKYSLGAGVGLKQQGDDDDETSSDRNLESLIAGLEGEAQDMQLQVKSTTKWKPLQILHESQYLWRKC